MEWLKPSAGVRLLFLVRQVLTAVRTLAASTLPSSTPHWSKLFRPQMNPCMFRTRVMEISGYPSISIWVPNQTAYQTRGSKTNYSNWLKSCDILCHTANVSVCSLASKHAPHPVQTQMVNIADPDGEHSRSRTKLLQTFYTSNIIHIYLRVPGILPAA